MALTAREENLLKRIDDQEEGGLNINDLKNEKDRNDLCSLVDQKLVEPQFTARGLPHDQFMAGQQPGIEEYDITYSLTEGGQQYLDEDYSGPYSNKRKVFKIIAIACACLLLARLVWRVLA